MPYQTLPPLCKGTGPPDYSHRLACTHGDLENVIKFYIQCIHESDITSFYRDIQSCKLYS